MGGGLIQLAINGAQDLLLTGDPTITFFKTVYRRYGNFSKGQKYLPIKRKVLFGNEYEVSIPKSGDLLSDIILSIELPKVRMKYKLNKNDEIDKLLSDNNIIMYNDEIINSNIANLKTILDFIDNSEINSETGFREPIINKYLIQLNNGINENNYVITIDILRILNAVTYLEGFTRNIGESHLYELSLDYKKFNALYNKLPLDDESIEIATDKLSSLIDLDFNLDLLKRTIYEAVLYDDIYLYLLFYIHKLINEFSIENINLLNNRDIILALMDNLKNKIILDDEVNLINRLRNSGNFNRKILKEFENDEFASDRIDIFLSGDYNTLFSHTDLNNVYFVYNRRPVGESEIAINIIEVLLFKRGDYNSTIDESVVRYQLVRNNVNNLQNNYYLSNSTNTITANLTKIINTEILPIDETIITIQQIFSVQKLYRITVEGNIIDLWNLSSNNTGKIIYIYNTNIVKSIPDGYLKILIISEEDYDIENDNTTFIIGINDSDIDNINGTTNIITEDELLINFDIFKPESFESISINTGNVIQYDSYETYNYIFNNTSFNSNLIDETFRDIVFNSIEYSLSINPILQRNVFESYSNNNLHTYQRFVYTPLTGIIDDAINKFDIITVDKNNFLNNLLLNENKTDTLKNSNSIQIPYINLINETVRTFYDNIKNNLKFGLNPFIDVLDDVIGIIKYYELVKPTIIITINDDLSNAWTYPPQINDTLEIDGTIVNILSIIFNSNTIMEVEYISGDFTKIKTGNIINKNSEIAIISATSDDFVENNTMNRTNFIASFNLENEFSSIKERSYSINYLLLDYLFQIYNSLTEQTESKNTLVKIYKIIYDSIKQDSFNVPQLISDVGENNKVINIVYSSLNNTLYNKTALLNEFNISNIFYVYEDIVNITNNYINNYYELYYILFNAEIVGASTSIRYQNIIENYEFNLDNLNNNYTSGISKEVQSIEDLSDIINFIINEKENTEDSLEYYNNNRNILRILNIYFNETNYYSVDSNIIRNKIENQVIKSTNPLIFYDKYSHSDTTLFETALNEVFNGNLTLEDNMKIIKDDFAGFYSDLILVRLVESSLEKDTQEFIITSNIIRIIETEVNNSIDDYIFFNGDFKSENQKTEFINNIIKNIEGNIIKSYITDYTAKYTYFKGAIITQEEKRNIEPKIKIINEETDEEELIRLIIDEIKHGKQIEDDPFLNIKLLLAFLLLISDVEESGDELLNKLIELVEIEYGNLFGLGYDFTLYKTCIITKEEKQYIIDNNNLPDSLEEIDNIVVRKSDLPHEFIYDKFTDELRRIYIYDRDYYFIFKDVINLKEKLLTGEIIDANILFNLLDTRKIDIIKMMRVLNDKNIDLINLLNTYNSNFAFSNRDNMDSLDMLAFMKLISNDIIYNKYKNNNIRIDYNSNQLLVSDKIYESQPLNISRIIDTNERIDLVGGIASEVPNLDGLKENVEIYLDEFILNQMKLLSLESKINEINNRTSIYSNFSWTDRIGLAMLEYIEYRLNDQVIERQYGDWINIYLELFHNSSQKNSLAKMLGVVPELTKFDNSLKPNYNLNIPLYFTFCRHNAMALPLIALPHTNMTVKFKLRKLEECITYENNTIFIDDLDRSSDVRLKTKLILGYIHLDKEERQLFAKSKHEYLVEQLQDANEFITKSKNINLPLEFTNPCIDLFWVSQPIKFINGTLNNNERQWFNYGKQIQNYNNSKTYKELILIDGKEYIKSMNKQGYDNNRQWFEYSNSKPGVNIEKITIDGKSYIKKMSITELSIENSNPVKSTLMTFNNRDRMIRMDGEYYNYIQPYRSHINIPSSGINYYSFALYPKELQQPSGSFNMSFVENNQLEIEIDEDVEEVAVRAYSRSKNILRIMGGQAGLAFFGN